jgi:hypothetical protein
VGSGSVWVGGSDDAGGAVEHFDPVTGRLLARIPTSPAYGAAADVATGQSGVWVAFTDGVGGKGSHVVEIAPATDEVVARIAIPDLFARRIALFGDLVAVESWTLDDQHMLSGTTLTLIDPATAQIISQRPFDTSGFLQRQGLAGGSVGYGLIENSVVQLDPQTGDVLRSYDLLPSSRPGHVVQGAGGLWVVGRKISRIDPSTGSIDRVADLPDGFVPVAVAASGEALYVLSWEGKVIRITPGG